MSERNTVVERKSKETQIWVELNIDGTGKEKIKTPIGLLTHMLDLFTFHGLFDLLTVLFLTRYMKRPMHLFGIMGALCFLLGFAINLYLTILWFHEGIGQRPLLFLGVLLLIVGTQFFSIGLLGEMLSEARQDQQTYSIKSKIW